VLSRSGSNFIFGIGSAYLALAAIALLVGRWLGYPRCAHGSRETKDLSNLC
jgi:hypothetical protein